MDDPKTKLPFKPRPLLIAAALKIRLSSVFLLMAFVCALLAWYVGSHAKTSIVGTWRFPTKDSVETGYYSSLTLRPDGTFLKTQNNRKFAVEFRGTYSVERSGIVVFTVSTKSYSGLISTKPDEVIDPEESHTFHYAVSDDGYLLMRFVDSTHPLSIFDDEEVNDSGIRWRSIYQPE